MKKNISGFGNKGKIWKVIILGGLYQLLLTTIDNVATLIKFSWTEIMQLPVETSKIPIWIV